MPPNLLEAGRIVFFAAWLSLVGGCVSTNRPGSVSGGSVGELHLFGMPVTMSVPGQIGPAGIGVRVYASAPGGVKGVPIREGILEVLMFDGAVGEAALPSSHPLKTWSFSADQLQAFSDLSFLGQGYQLGLKWENQSPKSRVVTVVARHRDKSGRVIYSAPGTISVSAR